MAGYPERRCLGCRKSFPKNTLIRIVKTPEGEIKIDPTGKQNGRGAYICKSEKCLINAVKGKQLDYSFKTKVSDEVYEKLKNEMVQLNNG